MKTQWPKENGQTTIYKAKDQATRTPLKHQMRHPSWFVIPLWKEKHPKHLKISI
jgi:hypothetical protein